MRTSILLALATLAPVAGPLHAQTLQAAPSGRATTEVTLSVPRARGDTMPAPPPVTIALDYGQPHLRGRQLHTDSLVPYDLPWRTGANSATTFKTGVDLIVGGVPVAKGSYFVYTLPGRAGWTLILQQDAGQQPGEYNAANDVARIDLRSRRLPLPIESLTMWLIPSRVPGAARGELRIVWEHVELSTDWSVR